MRITAKQLRRTIREELRHLNEQGDSDPSDINLGRKPGVKTDYDQISKDLRAGWRTDLDDVATKHMVSISTDTSGGDPGEHLGIHDVLRVHLPAADNPPHLNVMGWWFLLGTEYVQNRIRQYLNKYGVEIVFADAAEDLYVKSGDGWFRTAEDIERIIQQDPSFAEFSRDGYLEVHYGRRDFLEDWRDQIARETGFTISNDRDSNKLDITEPDTGAPVVEISDPEALFGDGEDYAWVHNTRPAAGRWFSWEQIRDSGHVSPIPGGMDRIVFDIDPRIEKAFPDPPWAAPPPGEEGFDDDDTGQDWISADWISADLRSRLRHLGLPGGGAQRPDDTDLQERRGRTTNVKLTAKQLRRIIKEELEHEYVSDIDQYPELEDPEETSHVSELLGTPEGTLLALMHARVTLDRYKSFPDLAADLGLEATAEMARLVAAIKANPMYSRR